LVTHFEATHSLAWLLTSLCLLNYFIFSQFFKVSSLPCVAFILLFLANFLLALFAEPISYSTCLYDLSLLLLVFIRLPLACEQECTSFAFQGLQLQLPELREYTYGFFAQLAEVLGAELAPLLPTLLPFALKSLDDNDTMFWDGAAETGASAVAKLFEGKAAAGGSDDDDDVDDDDDDDDSPLTVRTAMLDEKAAAAHCIGACAQHLKAAFLPYIQQVLPSLLAANDYFHEDVRVATTKALTSLVTAISATEPVPKWSKGVVTDLPQQQPMTWALLQRVCGPLQQRFEEDEDKDVVATASESIAQIALLIGPSAMAAVPPASAPLDLRVLVDIAVSLLEQRHACQSSAEADGQVDEDADHDEALWEAVVELLTTAPKALGVHWRPHFERLLPPLMPYLRDGHPAADHSLAIGIIAESINQLESTGSDFCTSLLPIMVRRSRSESVACRQNATFGMGVLSLHGRDAAMANMQSVLQALQARMSADEETIVRDNAVGALSRLVLGFGAELPLDSILPAIVASLPLKEDKDENIPAIRCLMKATHDERSRGHMAALVAPTLSVLARLLRAQLLGDEAAHEAHAFLAWLASQGAQQLEALVKSLPPDEQEALSAGLNAPSVLV